ncbi:hypothetical protein ACQ4LE_006846 [Meloidogyne hapla]|uniref:Uncharacterized protein n=1 Tax=Meloidogyne hapla TaxID=6305 RepID=A0A1I8BIV4_MELHA
MFNNKSTPLKRKKLSLKPNEAKDEEFLSPVKRRPKMSSNSKIEETFQNTSTTSSTQFIFKRPSIDESFISPLKQWQGFLSSPSSSDVKNYLKTPSPARMLKQSVICKNIGNLLLMTPEKDSEEEDSEENEEEEPKDEDEEIKKEERNPKAIQTKKHPNRRAKKQGGNFVKLNMRHRRFAPSSKFRIKKKWRRKFGKKF